MSAAPAQPTLGRVARHTGWNLAGQLLPVLVALVAIPVLIRLTGLERFGFLSLAWALVGYASLFDFGIGRALTRGLAQRLAQSDGPGAQALVTTAMFYLTVFGLALAIALAAGSPALVQGLLQLSPALQGEARQALWLLAASLPFVMTTAGYTGVLSAHQHFREINLVRMAMGLATFVGPLAVALESPRLDSVVASIVAMRVLANLWYAGLCARHCAARLVPRWPDARQSRELFAVGGWMSVSNFVSPLLTWLDRLALAAIVPVKIVALYTTPYDLLSRTMMLPYSLTTSLFPVAAGLGLRTESAWRLLTASTRALFLVSLPVTLVFFALAEPLLTAWLGADIAATSSPVLRVLALGMLCNALAQGPAMLIQASGNPKWMALLHLAELPLFALLFWSLSSQFGVLGAAVAASLRMAGDAVLVFALALRGMARHPTQAGLVAACATGASLLLAGSLLPTGGPALLAYTTVGLALFGASTWRWLLSREERRQIRSALGAAR